MDENSTAFCENDIFLAVSGRSGPVSCEVIAKSLWIKDTDKLNNCLRSLVEKKLLKENKGLYENSKSPKAEKLKQIMLFALAYDYDYNAYLDSSVVEFLRRYYWKSIFSDQEFSKLKDTTKILWRLLNDRLIIFFNYAPLALRIVQSPFLNMICEYYDIKESHKFFERKADLNKLIMAKMMAKQVKDKDQITAGRRLLFGKNKDLKPGSLPKIYKLLKYDLVPDNPELFDKIASQAFTKAMEKVSFNVERGVDFSLKLIHEYHSIIVEGTDVSKDIRQFEVQIGNNPLFKTSNHKMIPQHLENFVLEYKKRSKKTRTLPDILSLASYVHNELLHIHPYEDGNSRTAVVVMAHVLRLYKAPFDVIPKSYDFSFLQVTKGAKKRNDNDLLDLLKEILLAIFNQQELQEMANLDSQINAVLP